MTYWPYYCLLLQLPIVDSKDFSRELQARAVPATVQILNGQARTGSGVVVKYSAPFVYVLTAGHVVEKAEKLEVLIYSAESYPKPGRVARAEVVARDKDTDLAVVRFPAKEAPEALLAICPPRLTPGDKPFAALAVGCGEGQAPTVLVEKAGPRKVAGKPGEVGQVVWEVGSAQAKGRSGGPMVDGRGLVVGICSGTAGGKGYFVHSADIHRFLRQNGLAWLHEEAKPK